MVAFMRFVMIVRMIQMVHRSLIAIAVVGIILVNLYQSLKKKLLFVAVEALYFKEGNYFNVSIAVPCIYFLPMSVRTFFAICHIHIEAKQKYKGDVEYNFQTGIKLQSKNLQIFRLNFNLTIKVSFSLVSTSHRSFTINS
ncbi:hypothetical protein EGR_10409 [Echinococcus granulosus]|uniref:Uncharacterized protein n=1 Tax=Echinococcus granulosus TaxID=6210 RepID=W6U113_ECHGR|nr:hypothetical protein EGR_10409 [Echinococcus granulosus]EUB54728.1 hypothetical protein EGR_10409 [Echinococcus granulosus]